MPWPGRGGAGFMEMERERDREMHIYTDIERKINRQGEREMERVLRLVIPGSCMGILAHQGVYC